MPILPASSPGRAFFVAAQQAMGLLVLIFVVLRMVWLLRSLPAEFHGDLKRWEHRLAFEVHLALYGLVLAFSLAGFLRRCATALLCSFSGSTFQSSADQVRHGHPTGHFCMIGFSL